MTNWRRLHEATVRGGSVDTFLHNPYAKIEIPHGCAERIEDHNENARQGPAVAKASQSLREENVMAKRGGAVDMSRHDSSNKIGLIERGKTYTENRTPSSETFRCFMTRAIQVFPYQHK